MKTKIRESKIKDDTLKIASAAKRGRVDLEAAIQDVAISIASEYMISVWLLEMYVKDRMKDALIENSGHPCRPEKVC